MIFKVFDKPEMRKLFDLIASSNKVVGPVQVALDKDARPVYAYERVTSFDQLRLDHAMTKSSAKRYFMPHREEMASFEVKDGQWDKRVDFNVDGPLVLFGLHACDINALNKLDKVLLAQPYPMPYYAAKRKNMFLVGYDCMPEPHCFCRSMGADTALHGFDMFLTDLGEFYFAEVLTNTAYNFIMQVATRDPSEEDHVKYKKRAALKNASFTAHVDTTDLTKILDMEFQSGVWDKWGNKCFSCGSCSSVCPTCYCYGVQEQVELDLKSARKTKQLYSCNIIDFAEVAGGHNFRPERSARLKYRYYHKHRGFVEAYEESLCVGCGRCGEVCLGGIKVPEVIASIRSEEA